MMFVPAASRIVRVSARPAFRISSCAFNNIALEKAENGIAQLALNRDIGKNSLSKEMVDELNQAVAQIRGDSSIKVLIVKSNVSKVFCAGADLKERLTMKNAEVEAFVEKLRMSFHGVSTLPIPTIAAIEGAALGGGLELALACDIRIAGSRATLGLPETSLAIIPGAGGTQRLPRVIGVAKAKELIFTSARLTAEEAAAIGLVNMCVDAENAVITAEGMALKIVQNGPIGVRMAKAAIDGGLSLNIDDALKVEKACYAQVVNTEDRMEGINAFVEKRKSVYKGR
jgi:methylglutaconyl-CoA hydratase